MWRKAQAPILQTEASQWTCKHTATLCRATQCNTMQGRLLRHVAGNADWNTLGYGGCMVTGLMQTGCGWADLGNGVNKVEEVNTLGRGAGILQLLCDEANDSWSCPQGGTLQCHGRCSVNAVLGPDQSCQLDPHALHQHFLVHLQHSNHTRSAVACMSHQDLTSHNAGNIRCA